MNIILNNNSETFTGIETLTVDKLLNLKKFSFKMLVIKINGKLIKKEDYTTTTIAEGDDVMVLHLISGG
ncbi:MAG: sulfur carrier protein ThiS [Lentimicrobiaceae bacterium]|jgi:thiamine biosynthesis protein ThiS|nr:sulfur carrier protein ThiS [Lentimicrobiaceae bacterium]